jgi:hypothetical protein
MSQIELNIVKAVSKTPKWMPEIAKTSGVSLVRTRNTVARMFDRGLIDITRQGFIVAAR